jgi:hypothetical protein
MDEVFDSGLPAWKRLKKTSRLEDLERDIAEGNLKVTDRTAAAEHVEARGEEKV